MPKYDNLYKCKIETDKGGTGVKKWKIILSIIVFVLAAGGGTLYYFLNVKEYKTADIKVKKIVETEYTIKLPGDESKSTPHADKTANTETGTASQSGESSQAVVPVSQTIGDNEAASSGQQVSSTSNSAPVQTSKPTAAAIIAKYQPSFADLESQANGKLNSLVSYAMSEYKTKKANHEDISYFYFYSKYTSAAKTLESSTDASFNYVYNALANELKSAGYSASEAEPIKDQYASMKKQRRSALMSKAVGNS